MRPSHTIPIVAIRYADALLDLAETRGELKPVEADMADMAAMLESSDDLMHFVRAPVTDRNAQQSAMAAIAKKAKFGSLMQNFLGVLTRNGRLNMLPDVTRAFAQGLATRRGTVTASVTTAQALTKKQISTLQSALAAETQRDIAVEAVVDPEIMGGMIIKIGSRMIDDSVVRKLKRLKISMGQAQNQNTLTNVEEVA